MRIDKILKHYRLTQQRAKEFSKDPSTQVGATLLDPLTYDDLSHGYNGMPRKIDEKRADRWQRPIKYLYVEHAERNALYNALRKQVKLAGAIALVTMFPCADCARGFIQVDISAVVCPKPAQDLVDRWGAHFDVAKDMLEEAGVAIYYVEDLEAELREQERRERASLGSPGATEETLPAAALIPG